MEAENAKAVKEEEEKEKEETNEKRKEPGASRHGNFINYYQFHKVEERVRQLPLGVWKKRLEPTSDADRKYIALDVGCNVGDLTRELQRFLQKELPGREICLYGVDLDPILIERARELEKENSGIEFQCVDVMSDESRKHLESHLDRSSRGRRRFDAIFCFSITMWIHLNHGDEGLQIFLQKLCDLCEDLILIEPQPWKCYRTASRRLRRAGAGDFPLLERLELKGDVSGHLERMLRANGFRKLVVTEANDWNRKLLIYRRAENFLRDEKG